MPDNFSKKVFKYRSYTPIPFVLLMFFYENANIWSLIIGFLIAMTGELVRLWGVSFAGSETRTTGDVGGSRLIISGPFSYLRNPLYLGNILLYTGLGVMSYAIFPYLQIFGIIFFSFQYYTIIKEEEKYLYETFGNEYREYTKNVRRFIPRLTPYRNASVDQPEYNIRKGLKSERRSLQAFGLVSFTIFLLWFVGRL